MTTAAPMKIAIMKGAWPVGSESPACLKLMTWLRMAEVPYEPVPLKGPPKSKTGKAPYWIRDDGSMLDDSSTIIDEIVRLHDVRLDAERTPRERALMTLVQRTVEMHLYFAGMIHRWRYHPVETREAYFKDSMPYAVRVPVARLIRRNILKQAHAQGLGRRARDQVEAEALQDLHALEQILGDDDYFFGSPGVTDAIVYGQLENARAVPIEGVVGDALRSNPRWTAYLDRITERYWS